MKIKRTKNSRKYIFKVILLVFIGILLIITIMVLSFNAKCTTNNIKFLVNSSEEDNKFYEGIDNYVRPEESTYLTFPEWDIVYSSQEYAEFLNGNPPSKFPYFSSISQFWGSYCKVYGVTKSHYEFNMGNHFMLFVIGTSFSTENTVKGIYENTIGRITEVTSYQTEEDHYAQKTAQEYVDFIYIRPWYEFPFAKKLVGLWKDTPFIGRHIIRKWERKMILTFEYTIKTVYGEIIKIGTHSVYGYDETKIYAVIQGDSNFTFARNPSIQKIADLENNTYIVKIPRYKEFTKIVPNLSKQGVSFLNIAGNDEIFLTIIAPITWNYNLSDGDSIFDMEILTNKNLKRFGIRVPVKSLSKILLELNEQDMRLEHIYDY